MVLKQKKGTARIAKQLFSLLFLFPAALPAQSTAGFHFLGTSNLRYVGTIGQWESEWGKMQASGGIIPGQREKGLWSAGFAGSHVGLTAGSQFLPGPTGFLAVAPSLHAPPLRSRRSLFGGWRTDGIEIGGFGLEKSRKAGAYAAGRSFFAAVHGDGEAALSVKSSESTWRGLVDVSRIRQADARFTTEGCASVLFVPFDWTLDAEAERRASWDSGPASAKSPGAVDETRRGRSGFMSLGARTNWWNMEAAGQDRGRLGMRAAKLSLYAPWSVTPVISGRRYALSRYGEQDRTLDSSGAAGLLLRTRTLEAEILGEFRRAGRSSAEMRMVWKTPSLSFHCELFAAARGQKFTGQVHLIGGAGSGENPSFSSRRLFGENTAGAVLGLQTQHLFVYASVSTDRRARSSAYLHGEARFDVTE